MRDMVRFAVFHAQTKKIRDAPSMIRQAYGLRIPSGMCILLLV
jgi:hypothetical protein